MNLSTIQSQLESAKSEIDQLKTGRKVSASRARAALMRVKKETDILRKEILSHSKGLPVKQRKTKVAVSPVILEPSGSVSELPPAAVIPEKPTESLSELLPTETKEAAPKTKTKAKPRTKK
jgi:hypothetical protein